MEAQIASLTRQLRLLQGAVLTLLAALAVFATVAMTQDAGPARRVATFDEVTAGRLNIAGPDGVKRIILAHEMPQAPFGGEMLDRSVPPGMAGMIYCAANGDEVGGIGVSGSPQAGHALITLDYRNTPLEAIGLATHQGPQGQSAALVVMDNPTGTVDVRKLGQEDTAEIARLRAMMIERVSLGVGQHEAALVLKDRRGKPRIVLRVDAGDQAEIVILGPDGEERGRLPER